MTSRHSHHQTTDEPTGASGRTGLDNHAQRSARGSSTLEGEMPLTALTAAQRGERVAAESCREHVLEQGPNMMCTRDRGHEGSHRCKAADVDARQATGREYRPALATPDDLARIAELEAELAALVRIRDGHLARLATSGADASAVSPWGAK